MLRKAAPVAFVLIGLLVGFAWAMYARNPAPVVPPVPAEAANIGKPYVVKLHAKWCVVCMMTKGAWSEIEKTYAGRVNMVVFDFTTDSTTQASRAEAARLGLQRFFDDYAGATGTIVVLDGRTREVLADLDGRRDFGEYRAAIEAALK